MSGWYIMTRGWAENPVFAKEPFCERMAWIWMIERASFEPHTMRLRGTTKMVAVNRGQLVTANRVLAETFGWSVNRVRNFTTLLKNEGMIDTQADTHYTIITICNYDKYQVPLTKSDTPTITQPDTPSDTPSDTRIINLKNLKKEKKEGSLRSPSLAIAHEADFESLWVAWKPYEMGKGSKQNALKSYIKARKEANHETLISNSAIYCANSERLRCKTKHISAWLNGRCWQDDDATRVVTPRESGGHQGGFKNSKPTALELALADRTNR